MIRAPAGVSKAQSSSSGAIDGPPRRETIAVKTDGSEAINVTCSRAQRWDQVPELV